MLIAFEGEMLAKEAETVLNSYLERLVRDRQ